MATTDGSVYKLSRIPSLEKSKAEVSSYRATNIASILC